MRQAERPFAERLADRVRAIRRQAGMTQAEFAERIGLGGQSAVTRLESGTLRMIGIDVVEGLLDLAATMGVSAEELLTGRDCAASLTEADLIAELSRRIGDRLLAEAGIPTTPRPAPEAGEVDLLSLARALARLGETQSDRGGDDDDPAGR
ncbi:MAG TPA: helix-turn-helix transcriptional regulator [Phycisphaerae bacterium]|nr:helix-turn-helix transcriptional regulator [Phycisphaerae bacterium]